MIYSFDVAFSPHGLRKDGRRDLSRCVWVRAVVEAETLTKAHLLANQMVGVHGMTTEVLYRE